MIRYLLAIFFVTLIFGCNSTKLMDNSQGKSADAERTNSEKERPLEETESLPGYYIFCEEQPGESKIARRCRAQTEENDKMDIGAVASSWQWQMPSSEHPGIVFDFTELPLEDPWHIVIHARGGTEEEARNALYGNEPFLEVTTRQGQVRQVRFPEEEDEITREAIEEEADAIFAEIEAFARVDFEGFESYVDDLPDHDGLIEVVEEIAEFLDLEPENEEWEAGLYEDLVDQLLDLEE